MAVPKQKQTKGRRDRRRSHHSLGSCELSVCGKCGSPVMSHRACFNCGTYAGKEVIDVFAKLDKKEKKQKEKEIEEQQPQSDMNMEEMSQK